MNPMLDTFVITRKCNSVEQLSLPAPPLPRKVEFPVHHVKTNSEKFKTRHFKFKKNLYNAYTNS